MPHDALDVVGFDQRAAVLGFAFNQSTIEVWGGLLALPCLVAHQLIELLGNPDPFFIGSTLA